MKKLFVAAILLMSVVTVAVISAGKAFCLVNEDGFAVPASAGVAQLLAGGGGEAVALTHVQYDDVVYQHINGYYVGQQRAKIDITYPLYTHGGSGIRFLDEENWLITADVDVYQTFDGLYVSDGISYNSDMTQADEGEEFIFLSLSNGLYMNAQQATLSSAQGERVIPANSILALTEDAARWMEQRNGTLGYNSQENLFDATITIGAHTYSYHRLLDALGLVKKAIETGGGGQPDPDILQRADEILNAPENEKGSGSAVQPAAGEGGTGPDSEHGLGGNNGQEVPGGGDAGQGENEGPDDPAGEEKPDKGDQTGGDVRRPEQGGAAGGQEIGGSGGNGGAGQTGPAGEEGGRTDVGGGEAGSGTSGDGAGSGTDGGDAGNSGSGSGGNSGAAGGSGGISGGTGGSSGGAGSGGSGGGAGGGSGSGGSGDGSGSGGEEDDGSQDPDDSTGDDGSGGGGDPSEPAVQNELRVKLRARKRVDGEPAKGSQFTFLLKDKDRKVIQRKNNEDDMVVFDPLSLKEVGTYTYYIQEEEGVDPGFYYDTTEYRAEVTVTENEKGKLEAAVVYWNGQSRLSGAPIIQNGETGISQGGDGTGGEVGSGVSKPIPYQDPVVRLTDFYPWSYAVDMSLEIDDPSSAIQKGVKIAVYKDLKGGAPKNHNGATQEGNVWVWPAGFEGASMAMRQTKTRSQSFAMSPLQPGETYYIQYTYRYDEKKPVYEVETDADGNELTDADGNKIYKKDEYGNLIQKEGSDGQPLFSLTRKYVTSDLVEVTLPGLNESGIMPVSASWNTTYAAASDGLELTEMKIGNSSDYISDGSFHFALVDAAGNEVQTKSNTGGLVTFDTLSFDRTGVYSYRIVQKQASMENVDCDDAVYEAVIRVRASENTGRLVAFISYRKNGKSSGEPAFVNTSGSGSAGGDVSQYPASGEATGPDGTSSDLKVARVALKAGVTLDGKLTSGSNYDWENFKKNVLPYADRLELTLKPVGGGETVTVAAGASVLSNAAKGGALFRSADGVLQPNKQYTYSVSLKDRYGSVIPMQVKEGEAAGYVDSGSFSGTIYTQKQVPAVTITEESNDTSVLKLKIKVSDPDGALVKENGAPAPLRFTMEYSDGAGGKVRSELDGEWNEARVSHPDADLADGTPKNQVLLLHNPQNGSEYEITLTSLAFSRLFEAKAEGEYSPQPDVADTPETLEPVTAVFGTLNVYTARISDGLVGFTSRFTDLMDTSVTINLKMTSVTTQDVLALVDEFRVSLTDADGNRVVMSQDGNGKDVTQVVLRKSSLSGPPEADQYDEASRTATLMGGNHLNPDVRLYGALTQWTNAASPWDAFCIRQLFDGSGQEAGWSDPMELQISLPSGKLKPNTTYTLSVEPVVVKSQEDYPVPVRLTNTSFTTKKTQPTISYTLLAIADQITFSGLRITDPQNTILNGGEVRVELSDANSGITLNTQTITVGDTPMDLTFGGIITGAPYIVKFIAPAYNDTNNVAAQGRRVLEQINVTGSSGINGTLQLDELNKEDGKDTFAAALTVTADDIAGLLGREGEKAEVTLTLEHSLSMEQPEYTVMKTVRLPLEPAGAGSSALTLPEAVRKQIFEGLPADDGYRVTLMASYQGYNHGEPITLAQITFRTDSGVILVSTHRELYDALSKGSAAKPVNVLVVKDFEQDPKLNYRTVYGTVDFQGHIVSRRADQEYGYYFLLVERGGRVKNLVYDFPQSNNSVTVKAAVFYYVYGTVEDLIVRTHSPIEIRDMPILTSSLSNTGVVRNFIFSFDRDIRLVGDTTVAKLLTNENFSGRLEDGYLYGRNDAGILGVSVMGSRISGVISYGGTAEHIYVVSSFWSWTEYDNYALAAGFRNSYVSGDYYSITPDTPKTTNSRLGTLRTVTSVNMMVENVWALSRYSYTVPNIQGFHHAQQIRLRDSDWQRSVLGDGFEVEDSVAAGFYPRLKLSAEMQKYQEYIPLPEAASASAPTLVGDERSGAHTLNSGRVKLRFQNRDERAITAVEIEGLETVIAPVQQGAAADGLWDVYVDVKVAGDSSAQYLSSYKVNKFTYAVGASATQDVEQPNYTTENIEFWKEIHSASDWAAINDHMDWNYKLMEDIDFSQDTNLSPGDIIINGGRTLTGNKAFTGKLDGDEKVLSQIRLESVRSPWLFYQLSSTAQVRSLFVEDMVITADSSQIAGRGGLVGYCQGSLTNVRLKNCHITAGGNIGLLAGDGAGSGRSRHTFTDCSAADCTLTDRETGSPVFAGGLVGYGAPAMLRCYTRNVTMDITHSSIISGVGGLMGYRSNSGMDSCYAHGRITAASSYVGGLHGFHGTGDGSQTKRCVAYVNIRQTAGDYAGGLTGSNLGTVLNSAALGDVSGAGTHAYRSGRDQAGNWYYEGQTVKPLVAESTVKPLTAGQIGSAEAWLDIVRLGGEWDCGGMEGKYLPKLKNDCQREGWRQENIPLPGQSGEPTLKLVTATYNVTTGRYMVMADLSHPGLTHSALKAMQGSGLRIEVDGLEIGDGKAALTLSPLGDGADPEGTRIAITAVEGDFTRAYDNYALTVQYGGGTELVVSVDFEDAVSGEPHRRWIEVYNLADWADVAANHKETNENIKIMVMLDFSTYALTERGLRFNRLAGDSAVCGFENVTFGVGDPAGQSWVDKIAASIENITFRNCTFSFESVASVRSKTGVFASVSGADHVTLKNVRMVANTNCGGFGFFSNVNGQLSNITMEEVSLEYSGTRAVSNVGALVGTLSAGGSIGCQGSVTDGSDTNFGVRAKNILVRCPTGTYVGGILGYSGVYGLPGGNMTMEGVHIQGKTYVGGAIGSSYVQKRFIRVTGSPDSHTFGITSYPMNVVEGSGSAVGGISGLNGYAGGGDLEVTGLNITAKAGHAGGISGLTGHINITTGLVRNCEIRGTTSVGGVAGGNSNSITTLRNVQVVGCTVENTAKTFTDVTVIGAGGVFGVTNKTGTQLPDLRGVVVRDTKVAGPANVGGVYGRVTAKSGTVIFDHIYVAEDVTVTARGKEVTSAGSTYIDLETPAPAGGLFGYSNRAKIQDVICGATVMSGSSEAGGLIGHIEPSPNNTLTVSFERTAFVGGVTAYDYAGGLVGLLNGANNTLQFTFDTLKNSVVAANVEIQAAENGTISAWANFKSNTLDAGRGSLYVFEGATLKKSGEDAKAVRELYEALSDTDKSTTSLIPTQATGTRLWAATTELNDKSWYTNTLKWSVYDWALDHLGSGNRFMPYTKGHGASGARPLLEYVNKKLDGTSAGIPIPQYTSTFSLRRASVQAIYVSGVNTLTAEGWTELAVNGETLQADEDGLITFTWDFASPLNVDGAGLSPAEYARSIMIWGNTWYVIDGGELHYGSARGSAPEEMAEIGTVMGIGAPVHLWRGKVLTADGMIYSLSGGTASGGTSTGDSGKQASPAPICRNGGTEVYYGFTRVDGERVDGYRVFRMNGAGPRIVTVEEDAVYDGIVLNSTGSIILNGDGKLVNSMPLNLAGAYPDGINQISNSFGYDGSALLLRYNGGGVKGIDYVNGFEFFSTKPQSTAAAFTEYVRTSIKNLLSPIFGGGQDGLIVPEPSLVESEQLQNTLGNREPGAAIGGENDGILDDLEAGGKDDGTKPDTGGGTEGDIPGEPGDGSAEEPDAGESGGGDGESEAEGESDADGAGGDGTVGPAAGDGQTQDTGDASEAGGSGGLDGQNGGPNSAAGELSGAAGELSGEAGELSGAAGELASEAGELSGAAGELTGEAGELSGAAGELTGEAGELSGETGELSGEVGELSGEIGELSGKTGELSDAGKDSNASAGNGETSLDEEENPKADGASNREKTPEEQLVELFGDSVVLYSEKTGRYELFATETMLSDEPVGYEEMLAQRAGERNGASGGEHAVQEEDQESHFSVTGWGLGRSLDTAEKRGFALMMTASGVAIAGLAVLYNVIRRRKK